ncbi:MAG: ORF6N domain-containing protein [Lutibacter sp.]|nr:ORF6N domain-containing protein [Lutibacter sp.]
MSENQLMLSDIENRIFTIRGIQVMVDRDLAEMYQAEVKRLNEQVKRNKDRFPMQFRFQLTNIEKNELVANCDRFENLKHSSTNPFVFTEQGVAMLSAVLRSDIAIKVSIQIINAFVAMRKTIANNQGIIQRLDGMEKKQLEIKN